MGHYAVQGYSRSHSRSPIRLPVTDYY